MNPTDLSALLVALEPILVAINSIGLPGIIGVMLLAPAILISVVMIQSYASTRRMEKAYEQFQSSIREVLEVYRQDSQSTIHDVAGKHSEVISFYHKNVDLVKNYERMTDILHTLVVNNTRAVERLVTIIENKGK